MNRLKGKLVHYYSNGAISSLVLTLDECMITAIIIDSMRERKKPVVGGKYSVLFKEAETAIAVLLPPALVSIRNRLPCTVTMVKDDGILAAVVMDFNGQRLESLITSESASELCLRPGKSVFALVKSTEIMIEQGML